MNILIIGNGFDLAHKLPTQYKDFLDVLRIVKIMENDNASFNNFKFNYLKGLNDEPIKIIETFWENIKNKKDIGLPYGFKENLWLNYFINIYQDKIQGDGWIDLELEISTVVKRMDNILKKNITDRDAKKTKYSNLKKIDDIMEKDDVIYPQKEFFGFIKKLEADLGNFIQCLNWYLNSYALKISICLKSPDIEKIAPIDAVLSFNYTGIFDRLYRTGKTIKYDYIHGQVSGVGSNKNNIVLGISEYLDESEKNENVKLIRFKKYFQRIHKKTGANYKNWIAQEEDHNVYIFGHSLDESDKDILREIILNDRVTTTIFYHDDDESYEQKIINIVKTIGQDELIKKVYGDNPTIIFERQECMKRDGV